MEVLSTLSIGDGSVTPQKIYLKVDSDKSCYVILPDGSVLISAAGIIDTDWTGAAGKIKLVIPKNLTDTFTISNSDFIGNIKFLQTTTSVNAVNCNNIAIIYADGTDLLACYDSDTLYALSAASATIISCYGNIALENLYAPNAVSVLANYCALTAKSIGDFLFYAKANNPTAVGAIANFSDGTNANKKAVAEYINNTTYASAALGNAAFDTWIAANLASWSITANAAV